MYGIISGLFTCFTKCSMAHKVKTVMQLPLKNKYSLFFNGEKGEKDPGIARSEAYVI